VLPGPGEPLHVLFCGINPSLYSAATGWHFARPGNRFWPALHLSGFTPRRLAPAEQDLLGGYGLGITNLVARATAQAAELDPAELRAGGERLAGLIADRRPGVLAVAGVTAYRTAFGRPRAAIGPQPDTLGGTRLWILPNPSGLNAHTSVPLLAEDMRRLREALDDAELCRRLSARRRVSEPARQVHEVRARRSALAAGGPTVHQPEPAGSAGFECLVTGTQRSQC
jgi:TDG/mug DNA glycosylase family protein